VLPNFLLKKIPKRENIRRIRTLLSDPCVHTVCEEAKCPNIGECFSQGICTFMILGNICTRNCTFCGVAHAQPSPPDPDEPKRIAEAVGKLGLTYVVITSVTRDDLPDGGARHFAETIKTLRLTYSTLNIEVLIPDFEGNVDALKMVLAAHPYVLNHNLETVPRLYSKVRPQANYERSLKILNMAKEIKSEVYTKSGFMVGLGETDEEVVLALEDLRKVDCDIVTIGQYLPPSIIHPKPERYVLPETFEKWKSIGKQMGFKKIEAGPFVRSSYQAKETINV